jgi:hypothetical protein
MVKKIQESCVGCSQKADEHPFVGIGNQDIVGRGMQPVKSIPKEVNKNFRAFPVCEKCWADTSHRKKTLKMTFFTREDAMVALVLADHSSSSVGGGFAKGG